MNSENCKILSAPTYLKFDFRECYINQCKLKNIIPSSSSLASQNDPGKLKIYADRIKLCDWEALLSVLNIENSLKEICIYSKKTKRDWPQCVLEEASTSLIASACNGPPIFTSYVLKRLLKILGQSLRRSQSVCENLQIDLPLSADYALLLSKGLQTSKRLKHISLSGSCIGNEGCHYICDALKSMPNVQTLDLSNCKLGLPAIESLVLLIHSHGLMRSSISWESSFRYRSPIKKVENGLVRVTLNENPIGDEGAKKLATKLAEDLWIKAIDLQKCQIKNTGALKLLDMLSTNENIAIVDLRGNTEICKYLQFQIQQAHKNRSKSLDKAIELNHINWLPAPEMKDKKLKV